MTFVAVFALNASMQKAFVQNLFLSSFSSFSFNIYEMLLIGLLSYLLVPSYMVRKECTRLILNHIVTLCTL